MRYFITILKMTFVCSAMISMDLHAINTFAEISLAQNTSTGKRLAVVNGNITMIDASAAQNKEDRWFVTKGFSIESVKYRDSVIVGTGTGTSPQKYLKVTSFLDNDNNLSCTLILVTDLSQATQFTLFNPNNHADIVAIPENGAIFLKTLVSAGPNGYGQTVTNQPEYLGPANVSDGAVTFIVFSR